MKKEENIMSINAMGIQEEYKFMQEEKGFEYYLKMYGDVSDKLAASGGRLDQNEGNLRSCRSEMQKLTTSIEELNQTIAQKWGNAALAAPRSNAMIGNGIGMGVRCEPFSQGPGLGVGGFYGKGVYGVTPSEEESGGGSTLLNNVLSYGGSAATIGSLVGDLGKVKFGTQVGLIAAGVGAIVGILQSGLGDGKQEEDAESKVLRDYVTDQYEGIRQRKKEELLYGSQMAYGIQGGENLRDMLSRQQNGFLTARGDSYNQGMEASLKNMSTSYDGLLGEQKKLFNETIGLYESRKDSTKMDIQQDIESMIFGLGRTSDREYDLETQEQISVLAARFQENNAVVEKYKEDPSSVSDETLDEALANLKEVDHAMESLKENAYYKTHIAELDAEAENQLIDDIQAMSKDTMYTAGYDMGKNLSEGMKTAILKFEPELHQSLSEVSEKLFGITLRPANLYDLHPEFGVTEKDRKMEMVDSVHYTGGQEKDPLAFGMNFVPYDGYEATLHWGERVLTASENRQYTRNGTPVIINGPFYIREEADVDKVVSEIARKLELYHTIG